jgi:hypothetical protein
VERCFQQQDSGSPLGVAAVSAKNVWIIGQAQDKQGRERGSIQHWNGKKWTVYHPIRNGDNQQLYAITAVSAKNIWVVGGDSNYDSVDGLINHWNGTKWASVSLPAGPDFLSDVAGSSANNVWVAGEEVFGDGGD